MAQNSLGCENWNPSPELVEKLRTRLLPSEYSDLQVIRRELREMEERMAYGHEAKLALILTSNSTAGLSPEEEYRLKIEFEEWWENLKRGSMESVADFIERWRRI